MYLTKEENQYDGKFYCKNISDERFFNSSAVKNLGKFIKRRNGLTKKGLIIKGINKDLSFYRKQTYENREANKIELIVDIECPKCHKIKHDSVLRLKGEWETDKYAIRCSCERPIEEKYLSAPTTTEKGKKTARHGLANELWFRKFMSINIRAEKLKIPITPDWIFHASKSVDDIENMAKTKKNYFNFLDFIKNEFEILGIEFDEDATGYRIYVKDPLEGYNKVNCYIKPVWMSTKEAESLRAKYMANATQSI